MADKVLIELSPFDALEILCFLDQLDLGHPKMAALKRAVENYENEVYLKITLEQLEDAKAERQVARLLDASP